jgi:outer membrane receptor protein involved in Fe transport
VVDPASGTINSAGGLGLGTFLLGQVTTFNRYVSSSTNAQERQKRLFWYGQDTWRATSKLTINYGTRWEWVFPETVNEPGNGAALNLATGNLDVFGIGLNSIHGYQQMNWKEFAPRVGVAYQVTPKTVVRAGYGWSYSLGTFGSTFGHNVTQNPPVLANQNLNRANPFSGVFTLAQGPTAPQTVTPNINGSVPLPVGISGKARPALFVMPVTYTYNATVEQQLTNKVVVSAGYVGNQTRHGPLGTDQSFNVNEPFLVPGVPDSTVNVVGRPYYAKYGWSQDIAYYCNCANARYDSLQTTFKVNAAAGYTLQGNYTYQITQGDGFGSDNSYSFLYNRTLGWGNANNIPHHQMVLAQNFDVPFGRGRRYGNHVNRLVDAVLGGWNISGITSYYSGIPFNPVLSNHTAPIGPNDRPNKGSGDPFKGALGDRRQWYVGTNAAGLAAGTGGFAAVTSDTFGNYPINVLFGPHFINQDISLAKSFMLTERFKFTLRGDATNAFNHTNLGQPNNSILDGNAGQITNTAFGGAYLMRRMQFSGRISW